MSGLILVVVVIGVVLAVAWVILPLAIVGTKPLLRELIAETKRTNELLQRHFVDGEAASSALATVRCGNCRNSIAVGTRVCPHCAAKLAAMN